MEFIKIFLTKKLKEDLQRHFESVVINKDT